jgi:hypothetical protein
VAEFVIVWDDEDDPNGNVQHIARHGLVPDEVEQVLRNPRNRTTVSLSSERPVTFGRTESGKFIAVTWDLIQRDPRTVYPVTAYPVPPPRRRRP